MKARKLKVLFLIEDGSYLYDNRVRREAICLHQAGAKVSVICPNSGKEPLRSVVDGVTVYRYPKPALGHRPICLELGHSARDPGITESRLEFAGTLTGLLEH